MPDLEKSEVQPQGDGSFEDAVLTMPDIEALEQSQGEADDVRKPNPEGKKPDASTAADAKTKDEDKLDADAKDDDDAAEDFIELPPEEDGKEPTKVKLADVVGGWRKSADLEKQLDEAKRLSPQLPHQIEEHVAALQAERGKFTAALVNWAKSNMPQRPNEALINPASNDYNPEEYYAQTQRFNALVAEHTRARVEFDRLNDETAKEKDALRASRISREQAEIQKFWPEVLTDEKTRVTAKAELAKHYGIDDKFLDSDITLDHRIYALAKDALAYRAGQAKQAEAVKTVKAKPKLIPGQARVATDTNKARRTDGYRALQKSGSLDDAADALEGLL